MAGYGAKAAIVSMESRAPHTDRHTSSFANNGCPFLNDIQNENPGTIRKYQYGDTVDRYHGASAGCVMEHCQSFPLPTISSPVIRLYTSPPMVIPKPRKSE